MNNEEIKVNNEKMNVGVGVLNDLQRKKQMKNKKEAYLTRGTGVAGITLIALIITIIVMLILAMVSIKVASDSGLFKNAETAVSDTEIETIKEQLTQAVVASYKYEDGTIDEDVLKSEINKIKGKYSEEKIAVLNRRYRKLESNNKRKNF